MNEAFAEGVRRSYTKHTSGAQRRVADDFAQQLHWCDAERTRAKDPYFFLLSKQTCFFLDALLLCQFGEERQDSVLRPFLASSPLSVAKVDVSEISNRLPDYFTLKNNSHEA